MTSEQSGSVIRRVKALIGAAELLWRMRGFVVRVLLDPEGIRSFAHAVGACEECSDEFRPGEMCEAHREHLEYWAGGANLGDSS